MIRNSFRDVDCSTRPQAVEKAINFLDPEMSVPLIESLRVPDDSQDEGRRNPYRTRPSFEPGYTLFKYVFEFRGFLYHRAAIPTKVAESLNV